MIGYALNFNTFRCMERSLTLPSSTVFSNPSFSTLSLFFKYSKQVQASLMRTYCEREKADLVGPDNRCAPPPPAKPLLNP